MQKYINTYIYFLKNISLLKQIPGSSDFFLGLLWGVKWAAPQEVSVIFIMF